MPMNGYIEWVMSHVNDVIVMNDDHVNDVMSHQSSLSYDVI